MIGCCEWEVHDCCLKSYGVFYFSNMWWDHIPDLNCSGVLMQHLVAMQWPQRFEGFNRPRCGVMLNMLFNIL